jgi:hypothetical protein
MWKLFKVNGEELKYRETDRGIEIKNGQRTITIAKVLETTAEMAIVGAALYGLLKGLGL